ncbi:hypothetical protein PTSG_12195 [Salpingoeca rosetta]|uniref:Centrosomal protein of 135 kDa n=1 Tax=Salpingoeca rosetta (strain ATCC 50818 / BSB-021) TaxID=946362 RepID=F2U807_SALR5|nr:uncharacterized protein PTSG_12195 [Salpingoeca rosetta]EGD72912.1 hypothetical protein PTSG_12195 [Salpingoeca rosetta]|eukprot:XP_004994734.1 hypothetical protein PTSG_12195 [Salpingoeca rosetta]
MRPQQQGRHDGGDHAGAVVEARFKALRQRLDQLGYRQPLGIESLPLVDKLFSDLLHTTLSLKQAKEQMARQDRGEGEHTPDLIAPYKEDNAKLVKEVNELHMEIVRRKDVADAQTKTLKAHMRQLQHENADLRFLNSQYAQQIKSLEKESDVRQKRIDRLLEKNLQAVITTPEGNEATIPTRRQRMEMTKMLPPAVVSSQPAPAPPQQQHVNVLRAAEKRTKGMQARITQLETEKKTIDAKIEAMQAQVARRDKEIERLGDLLQGGRPLESLRAETRKVSASRQIAKLETQVDFLQTTNKQLQDELVVATQSAESNAVMVAELQARNDQLAVELARLDHLAGELEKEKATNAHRQSRQQQKQQQRLAHEQDVVRSRMRAAAGLQLTQQQLKRENEYLVHSLSQQKQEIAALRLDIDKLVDDNEFLKSQLTAEQRAHAEANRKLYRSALHPNTPQQPHAHQNRHHRKHAHDKAEQPPSPSSSRSSSSPSSSPSTAQGNTTASADASGRSDGSAHVTKEVWRAMQARMEELDRQLSFLEAQDVRREEHLRAAIAERDQYRQLCRQLANTQNSQQPQQPQQRGLNDTHSISGSEAGSSVEQPQQRQSHGRLEKQWRDACEEISRLTATNRALQAQLHERNEELKRMRSEWSAAQGTMQSAQLQAQRAIESERHVEDLKVQLRNCRDDLQRKNDDAAAFEEKIVTLEQQIHLLKAENRQLAANPAHQRTVNQLTQENEELQRQLAQFKRQVKQLDAKYREEQAKVTHTMGRRDDMLRQMDEAWQRSAEMQEELQQLQNTLFERQCGTLEGQIEAMQRQLVERNRTIQEQQQDLDMMTHEYSRVQRQLEVADQLRSRIQTSSLESKLTELGESRSSSERQHDHTRPFPGAVAMMATSARGGFARWRSGRDSPMNSGDFTTRLTAENMGCMHVIWVVQIVEPTLWRQH